MTDAGNFERSNILAQQHDSRELATHWRAEPEVIEERLLRARQRLLAARAARMHPGRDEKVISAWNGLMLTAFAEAARVLVRADFLAVAEKNAHFLLDEMRDHDGRMLRVWKDGRSKTSGFLEDHAQVAEGLLELYTSTFDPCWFVEARRLCDLILAHYTDTAGGFFDTGDDHETLIARPKGVYDGAQPSGGSTATMVLSRMGAYTGESRYIEASQEALAHVQTTASAAPLGYAQWLSALDFVLAPPKEVAIIGTDVDLLAVVFDTYRPNVVVASGADGADSPVPLLQGRTTLSGAPTAYVCRQFTFHNPVTETSDLAGLLDS